MIARPYLHGGEARYGNGRDEDGAISLSSTNNETLMLSSLLLPPLLPLPLATTTRSKGTPPCGLMVLSDESQEEHRDGPPTKPRNIGRQHQHTPSPSWRVSLHPCRLSRLAEGHQLCAQVQPFLVEVGSSAVLVFVLDRRGGAGVPHPRARAAGPYSCASPRGTYSCGNCHHRQHCCH
jgi:hypothetical protein